jgi:diketogulonate reductase-like aldo/keto reductase
MRSRPFGRDGREVPVAGQGTWLMEKDDRPKAIEAIRAGIDAGATHIDTAELYGDGEAERITGEAIRDRRDRIFLVSKVLPRNASRSGTLEACRRSLERLETDSLDCYLLHWLGPHPIAETFEAFEELRQEGLIRSWGVSNLDEVELAKAIGIAGEGAIACNQVLYHLGERAIEHRVIPFCRERGIAVVAYSPFGSGSFPSLSSAGGRTLREIAGDLGCTARQVALAFLLRHDNLFVIPKSSDPAHARENAAAAGVELTAEQIDRIDRAFPRAPWRGGVPFL